MLLSRQLGKKRDKCEVSLGQRPWTTSRKWLVLSSNEVMDQMISLLLVKKSRFSQG